MNTTTDMTTNTDGAMPELPEPAHWRAVLDPEQVPQQLKRSLHVVGFRDKRAAEGWIAERLDFDGWRYTLEGLYTADQVRAAIQQAAGAVPGWKLVPIDATVEMVTAAIATGSKNSKAGYWAAMLAASPTPPKQQPVPLGGGEGGGVQVPKYDLRMMYLEKEKGTLDLRIEGLSMRQIKDIFEQEYGALMWSEGSAYPCTNVKLQFIRADLAPRPESPSAPDGGGP